MTRRGFVVHHNGPPAQCVGRSHDRCVSFWGGVKRYHGQTFGAKWAATSLYSFGICPHGVVFTGCGWNGRQAANGSDQVGANDGRDSEWYTVLAFVGGGAYGGYDTGSPEEPVSPKMAAAIERLIYDGRARGFCGDQVLPHNAFKRKACPGPTLTRLAAQINGTHAPAPQEDDMHGTEVIAAYGEAGYLLATLHPDKLAQHWRDIRAWTHAIYAKPEAERAGGVAYVRALLGLN